MVFLIKITIKIFVILFVYLCKGVWMEENSPPHLTILLSKKELGVIDSILGEVCHGIKIGDFVDTIGLSMSDLEALLKKVRHCKELLENSINIAFDYHEILAIHNAFNIVHLELEADEFQTRTGYNKDESNFLLQKWIAYEHGRQSSIVLSDNQYKAAELFVGIVFEHLGKHRNIAYHETAIAATARLAGSMLLRFFQTNLADYKVGSILLSNEAGEWSVYLIHTLGSVLDNFGIYPNGLKPSAAFENENILPYIETMNIFQTEAMCILKSENIDLWHGAGTMVAAVGLIINKCRDDIDINAAFDIAAYAFVEAMRTVPPSFSIKKSFLEILMSLDD